VYALTEICLSRHATSVRETTWAALADPNRRAVLGLLRQRPRAVGELVGALRLSQPATSKHLRVLREAGLVRVVPQAQRRIYAIDPAPLAELDAWLAPYRELWNDRLDALGRYLDAFPTHPDDPPREI
jgi:DNA-binding transcriptional ArsR family regulator